MAASLAPETLELLSRFFRKVPAVRLAYLFGSQARGEATPRSDIDLAVQLDPVLPEDKRTGVRIDLINRLIDLLRTERIDLIVLNDAPPLLRHRVARDGIVLHEDDPDFRIDFVVRALRDYEDTRPLREVQASYLLRRLGQGKAGEKFLAKDGEKS